jgi:hypothetical protein
MTETVTRTILLKGGAIPPSALAWRLREHGVEVEPWEAPEEGRGIGTDIVIAVVVAGGIEAIKAGLADFRGKFPGAEATIEETTTTTKTTTTKTTTDTATTETTTTETTTVRNVSRKRRDGDGGDGGGPAIGG